MGTDYLKHLPLPQITWGDGTAISGEMNETKENLHMNF